MKKKLLYHYTSIETFALILKNRTIRFNNLKYVDDLEEVKTEDMEDFGRLLNVSCWTDDVEESIPLWKLYTPDMNGVRIGLPEFPFKKYHFKAGEYGLKRDIDTFIDLAWTYDKGGNILAEFPQLVKVEYTDNEEKLFPKIRQNATKKEIDYYVETRNALNGTMQVNYSLENLGKCKRNVWSFQKELRYIINCFPISLKEMTENPTFERHIEMIKRIEYENSYIPFKEIFLKLNDNCFNEMDILMGPKIKESEKIIVKALLKEYAPNVIAKESCLKINL